MESKHLPLSEKFEKLVKNANFTDKKTQSLKRTLDTTLFDKISEKGLLEKTEYTLPLKDTIGQQLFEALKFKNK
ncbi:MAG: hypothetical protein GDA42_05635 [Ekhidna sp.]|nr:hypothetical protein [Ekhidna sp.]MBC6409927.1 hypothetical protein [Ekhidna sp.]